MTNQEKSDLIWHVWIQYIADIDFFEEWCDRACNPQHVTYSLNVNQRLISNPNRLTRDVDYYPYWPERSDQIQNWHEIRKYWDIQICPNLVLKLQEIG